MAYLTYTDSRYGDLYEINTDDTTGTFEGALRSVGGQVSGEKIYYSTLAELPPHHRNQIEHLIWNHHHPRSSSRQ